MSLFEGHSQASTNLTIIGHFQADESMRILYPGTYIYEIFSQHRSSVKMFHWCARHALRTVDWAIKPQTNQYNQLS